MPLVVFRNAEQKAQSSADEKITSLRAEFQKSLDDVNMKTGLDENAKNQLRAQIQRTAQRRPDADIRATKENGI